MGIHPESKGKELQAGRGLFVGIGRGLAGSEQWPGLRAASSSLSLVLRAHDPSGGVVLHVCLSDC